MADKNRLYGIKLNGPAIELTTLSIEEDQTSFEYICNVSLCENTNGNGYYSISILNQHFEKGLPIGDWKLIEGRIGYDWGCSTATFIMEDSMGKRTTRCFGMSGKGSARGFDVDCLTRSIFPAAIDIVASYPNAEVYNVCVKFLGKSNHARYSSCGKFRDVESPKESVTFFKKENLQSLQCFVDDFENLVKALEDKDDLRSKNLLNDAFNKFKEELKFMA